MPKRPHDVAVYDRIGKWISNPEKFGELHPADAAIFYRWSTADDFLRRFPSRKQCVKMMVEKFRTEKGYCDATAYRDLANAQVLFGTVNVYNKEYIKNWLVEDIMKLIQKAREKGDFKALNAAHANLIKVMGLDREDKSIINPEDLEAHRYYQILIMNGEAMKIDLDKLDLLPVATRSKIVNAVDNKITEDIAFEMINAANYEQTTEPEPEPASINNSESEG